jgi:hypothetical protein
MMQDLKFVTVGNTSSEVQTKASHSQRLKKKYNYTLFVREPPGFKIGSVLFNINMGEPVERPVRVDHAPFCFENRTTFAFSCSITIIPRDKIYRTETVIHRIEIGNGEFSKNVAIRKK